jgi:hypothetical protein
MEAIRSSETSVDFQQTTRFYIPEDSTLQEIYVCNFCEVFLTSHFLSFPYLVFRGTPSEIINELLHNSVPISENGYH